MSAMSQVPVRRQNTSPAPRTQEQAWRDPIGLWRWDPFRDMENMISRMFRGYETPPNRWTWEGESFIPPVDIEETEDAYTFDIDLPGVRREDVNVEVSGAELHITGQIVDKERVGVMRQRTRRTGSFEYWTTLPGDIDPDHVEATFTDGVLSVRVPRSETTRPRKIKIS
jgi:HSP20 family protein